MAGGINVIAHSVNENLVGFTTFYLADQKPDYKPGSKTVTVYRRSGNVGVTGDFSNVEMGAVIEAIIEWVERS